jgi:hypothetical protein
MATDNMTIGDAIMTPEFRVSFPSVFEPNEYDGKQSYALTMLFPKGSDMKALYAAAEAVARKRWGNNVPQNLPNPFRDGDQASYDGYQGMLAVKASNYVYNGELHKARPNVVDQNVQPILSGQEFYAGCWARATIIPKATGGPGTKYGPRVSFGIRNIQKLRDDEPFGSTKVAASEDFDPVEGSWGGGNTPDPEPAGSMFGGGNGGGGANDPNTVANDPLFG